MRDPALTAGSEGFGGSADAETKLPLADTAESRAEAVLEATSPSPSSGPECFSCSGAGFQVSLSRSLDVEFDMDVEPDQQSGGNRDMTFALTVLTLIVSSIAARFDTVESGSESPPE